MYHFRLRRNLLCLTMALGLWCGGFADGAAAPISLQVVDADVRAVLMSAARMGGFNVVLDDSVKGTITLNLLDVEPEEVLRFVAGARNLSLQEMGGTYVVTSAGNAAGLYAMHTFAVRYGNPEELKNALQLSLGFPKERKKTEKKDSDTEFDGAKLRERIMVDTATNTILLYGTYSEAAQARNILKKLDVPAKQVSLEAKVISIEKEASKKLGVEWKWSGVPQYPETTVTNEEQYRMVTTPEGKTISVRETVPKEETKRTWQGGASVPGVIQFGRGPGGHPYEFYYEATINALVTDGKAKILARPNVTTIQGREAVINIGGEIPVPKVSTTNSTVTTSIEYKESGIILRYTPRVNEDGYITATVHTEVSSPLYVESMKAYRFQKRSADTSVRLRDGETMVIGGLIGSEESRSLSKVPFLGDLPILGAFFKSVRSSKTDSEILIFLTAHVLDESRN